MAALRAMLEGAPRHARRVNEPRQGGLSTPEELIDDARNGRMIILVDDEDRENEGDLVLPAQMATPTAINFMATHARGLICLALTRARVEQLGLDLMSRENGSLHETAFTTSIDARDGITTGISAADRACTIAAAIDASKGAETIVTPGHVFPLMAREGGILVRAGHTEAAVDIARLAGLNASGVICEIMREDGTMARLDDLVAFSQRHGIRIGTIRDLIAFRLRRDNLMAPVAEASFESRWGNRWIAKTFLNKVSASDQLALVLGQISDEMPTLVRMHQVDFFRDTLLEDHQRSGLLQDSIRQIEAHGAGVIVLINNLARSVFRDQLDVRSGKQDAGVIRDYGVGAQILCELGVKDIILLTTTRQTPVALAAYGIRIVEERPIARYHWTTSSSPIEHLPFGCSELTAGGRSSS